MARKIQHPEIKAKRLSIEMPHGRWFDVGDAVKTLAEPYDSSKTYESGDYALIDEKIMRYTGSGWVETDDILNGVVDEARRDIVTVAEQTLTDEQQEQVRDNIGALASNQGGDNHDKVLGIDQNGNVVPVERFAETGVLIPITTDLIAGDGESGAVATGVGVDELLLSSAQTLTDGQKSQARTNIGAADAGSVAALEAENAAQGMQIANLKAALYGTVIEDEEHTFAKLDSAPIPSHLHDGTAYHKVFDGSELMISKISGRTAAYRQLIRVSPSDKSKYENGVHITDNRDGTYTVWTDEDGATADTYVNPRSIDIEGGHKYFLAGCPAVALESGELRSYIATITDFVVNNSGAATIAATSEDVHGQIIPVWVKSGTVLTDPVTFAMRMADLTAMYGAGNEPVSAAEFLADCPAFAGNVPYADSVMTASGLDGVRVSGAAGSTAEPWEFELSETQTLHGVGGVADTISIVEAGNGLYNVVKTTRFAFMDMGTMPWTTASVTDGFNCTVTSYGAKLTGKALAYGYTTRYDSPVLANMSDMEIAVANTAAVPIIRLKNAAFDGFSANEVKTALSGQMIAFELLTPVTTTLASGLTEAQVACLTELGGSIAVIGNDSSGFANPDVGVILQIEKAVEE